MASHDEATMGSPSVSPWIDIYLLAILVFLGGLADKNEIKRKNEPTGLQENSPML